MKNNKHLRTLTKQSKQLSQILKSTNIEPAKRYGKNLYQLNKEYEESIKTHLKINALS